MSMQTAADSATSGPFKASALQPAPTSANRTNLFEDATADNFITVSHWVFSTTQMRSTA